VVAFLFIGGIGFLMLALTWLMGELFDLGHEVASFFGDHEGGLDSEAADAGPSPFSSRVIFTFMTAFGGGGAAATMYGLSTPRAVGVALAAGVLMGAATWAFARLVFRQQATSGLEMSALVGRTGRVAVGIPAGGVGQVSVSAAGGSSTFLARAANGEAITAGGTVSIAKVEGDVLLVAAGEPRQQSQER